MLEAVQIILLNLTADRAVELLCSKRWVTGAKAAPEVRHRATMTAEKFIWSYAGCPRVEKSVEVLGIALDYSAINFAAVNYIRP